MEIIVFFETHFIIQLSVLHFIKRYNIPKELFLRVSHEAYPNNMYTDEEIEMFYSADIDGIYSAFISEYAILAGGTIYSPLMLEQMTFDGIKEAGITEDVIADKMPLWGARLGHTAFYAHMLEICNENNIEFVDGAGDWSNYVAENGYLKNGYIIYESDSDYEQLLAGIKESAE